MRWMHDDVFLCGMGIFYVWYGKLYLATCKARVVPFAASVCWTIRVAVGMSSVVFGSLWCCADCLDGLDARLVCVRGNLFCIKLLDPAKGGGGRRSARLGILMSVGMAGVRGGACWLRVSLVFECELSWSRFGTPSFSDCY